MVAARKERRSDLIEVETPVPRRHNRTLRCPTTTSPGPAVGETLAARAIAACAADSAEDCGKGC